MLPEALQAEGGGAGSPSLPAASASVALSSPLETPGSKGKKMGGKLKKLGRFFSAKKLVRLLRMGQEGKGGMAGWSRGHVRWLRWV